MATVRGVYNRKAVNGPLVEKILEESELTDDALIGKDETEPLYVIEAPPSQYVSPRIVFENVGDEQILDCPSLMCAAASPKNKDNLPDLTKVQSHLRPVLSMLFRDDAVLLLEYNEPVAASFVLSRIPAWELEANVAHYPGLAGFIDSKVVTEQFQTVLTCTNHIDQFIKRVTEGDAEVVCNHPACGCPQTEYNVGRILTVNMMKMFTWLGDGRTSEHIQACIRSHIGAFARDEAVATSLTGRSKENIYKTITDTLSEMVSAGNAEVAQIAYNRLAFILPYNIQDVSVAVLQTSLRKIGL